MVIDGATAGASHRAPLVSEVEAGQAIMRPMPGPRTTELPFTSLPLTAEQWTALDHFLRVTLFDATVVFDMPVFKPDGCVVRKCQIKGGVWSNDLDARRVSFTLIIYNW